MVRPVLQHDAPLSFAHRGGAGLWPENTALAFKGGITAGCTHLETDVRLTKDGKVVCIHDATVDRTTSAVGRVRDFDLSELQALDAGEPFGMSRAREPEARILALDELLGLDADIRVNVELKEVDPALAKGVWATIERFAAHDRVLVAAADVQVGTQFRRISGGRVATSASRREVATFWAATLSGGPTRRPPWDALQIPIRQGPIRLATPSMVAAAHRLGLHVHVWTVDDAQTMRSLLRMGVDGVMSDRPRRLVRVCLDHAAGASST